jgi:hypothetical protein
MRLQYNWTVLTGWTALTGLDGAHRAGRCSQGWTVLCSLGAANDGGGAVGDLFALAGSWIR